MITANGHKIVPTIFPDKTSQVWKLPEELLEDRTHHIIWHFEEEREILDLLSFYALLPRSDKTLYMPYLPFARQDKEVGNDSSFNLHVFGRLINMVGFDRITALDVHNPEETASIIRRFMNISAAPVIERVAAQVHPDFLVYPDLGARNRYAIADLAPKRLVFYKHRDPTTGKITGHDISYRDSYYGVTVHTENPADLIKEGETFLVVDDICDGGATFLSIAEKLKATGKNPKLHLYVTHGLFSRGRGVLTEAGYQLHTTNSLLKNADGYEV